MNEINIDLIDRKILYQLDLNARQSNAQIGKKISTSKEVVNYRIKRLEKEGYISGYHTIINFWKLGYQTIRVYLKFIDISPENKVQLMDFLIKKDKVLFILETEGVYDLGFGVLVKNLSEFEKFYEEFKASWKPFIIKEQISFYNAIYHFNRDYLLEKQNNQLKSIVIKEEPEIAHEDNDIISQLISFCNKNPNIIYIVKTIGGADLECGVEVPHREAFDNLMDEMRKSFKGIREIIPNNLRGYKKYLYFLK